MKSISALCIILFSLLLLANLSCGRRDMGDYWKKMMENQPMPEVIKDLVVQDQPLSGGAEKKKDGFVRDFDIRPNVIIYHTDVVSEKKKPVVKNFEQNNKKG